MRIEGGYRAGQLNRTSATRGSSGGVFQLDGGGSSREAQSLAPMPASPTIDSLLALQSVEDPLQGRRRVIRRGNAMLDTLDAIKADLLTGQVGEGRLNALMALVGQAREEAEPAIQGVLDEIELRARVELAKLGRLVGQDPGPGANLV